MSQTKYKIGQSNEVIARNYTMAEIIELEEGGAKA